MWQLDAASMRTFMLCTVHLLAFGDGAACRKVQPTILQLAVLPYVRSSGGVVHQAGNRHHGLTFHNTPINCVSNLHAQSVSGSGCAACWLPAQVHDTLSPQNAHSITCILYAVQICTACGDASMSEHHEDTKRRFDDSMTSDTAVMQQLTHR